MCVSRGGGIIKVMYNILMNKFVVEKEMSLEKADKYSAQSIVKQICSNLDPDIKVLMSMGYKFELFCRQENGSFKVTITSHDKLSILKDSDGNIINVIKK